MSSIYRPVTVYNVKDYGAVGDGLADDTTSIQAAIADAQVAGGGTVYFPNGAYAITSALSITNNYVRLLGTGPGATRIIQQTVGAGGITVAGSVGGGTWVQKQAIIIEMLDVIQPTPGSNAASGNIGISFFYTGICQVRDVNVIGFFVGIKLQRATQTIVERTQCVYNTGTAPSPIGFLLDGAAGTGGGSLDTAGNNSSVFRDCNAAFNIASTSATTSGTGFSIFSSAANGNCSDLTFDDCSFEFGSNGWAFDFSNVRTQAEADSDIQLINPVPTDYLANGILISGNPDNETSFAIHGGFFAPSPQALGNVYGIQIQTFRGASIVGAQFFPNNVSFGPKLTYGIYCGSGVADVAISGCQFNGLSYGISFTGAQNCAATGNRFFSTPSALVGQISSPAVAALSAKYISVVGNTFSATTPGGMASGVYFDTGTTLCVASGNAFSSNVSFPVVNNGATNRVSENPGFNPVGAAVSPPALVSGTIFQNTTGVDCHVYLHGTTVTSVAVGSTSPPGTAVGVQTYVYLPASWYVEVVGTVLSWVWLGA